MPKPTLAQALALLTRIQSDVILPGALANAVANLLAAVSEQDSDDEGIAAFL